MTECLQETLKKKPVGNTYIESISKKNRVPKTYMQKQWGNRAHRKHRA